MRGGRGLAVGGHIVEDHGGHLELESEEGRGADFHFSLPIAADLATGAGGGSARRSARRVERGGGRRPTSVPPPGRSGRGASMRARAPLRIVRSGMPVSSISRSLKSGSWPTKHDPPRAVGRSRAAQRIVQDRVDRGQVERIGKPPVVVDGQVEDARHGLCRLHGADLGAADEKIRAQVVFSQEARERLGLAPAPRRQGPLGVGAGPFRRITGMGMAQERSWTGAPVSR